MAYRNFSALADLPLSNPVRAGANDGGFTDLEWSVVRIARQDSLSSIEEPGRFARMMSAILGSPPRQPLANARLEALRRFVVLDNHLGDRLPDREAADFVGAGFSWAHVRLLRTRSFPSSTEFAR